MNPKPRFVHLITFVALIVSLFSPVLTQAVTADDPPPEPEISLQTNESTPDPNLDIPTETPIPTIEPTSVPELIPVIPATPILADASCVDGAIYAQTATAPVTDGVQYEIGAADAEGNFTVTATLTDPATYRWADSGLDGWVVNGYQATSSGVLELCPNPEPETPAPTAPKPTEEAVATEEPTASTPDTETVEKPSSESTPAADARSSDIGPTANEGAELTYTLSANKTHAVTGDEIEITITVKNDGTGNAENYNFMTDLSKEGEAYLHKEPMDLVLPSGASCYTDPDYTTLDCSFQNAEPLAPGNTHTYIVTVVVATTAACGSVETRGGGEIGDGLAFWEPNSQYRGGNLPSFKTTVNCAPKLSLTASNDAGDSVEPGDSFNYTITITRSGEGNSGAYAFESTLPNAIQLSPGWDNNLPANTSCDVTGSFLQCSSSGIPATETVQTFSIPVYVVSEPDSADCGTNTMPVIGGLGAWGDQYQDRTNVNVVCAAASLTYNVALVPVEDGPLEYGDEVQFTVTITNEGSADSGAYSFITDVSVAGVAFQHKTPKEVTAPDGLNCYYGTVNDSSLNCGANATQPISPGGSHVFTAVMFVNTQVECATILTQGGGISADPDGTWSENSPIYPESYQEIFTTVNCAPKLALDMINDHPAPVEPGDTFNFEVTATKSGVGETGEYTFMVRLPEQLELDPDSTYTTPANASCSLDGVDVTCVGEGVGENESEHTFKIPVRVKQNLAPTDCGSFISNATGLDQIWGSNNTALSYVIRVCGAAIGIEIDNNTDGSVHDGEEFNLTVTVSNSGQETSGSFSFEVAYMDGIELAPEDPFTVPVGHQCGPYLNGVSCSGTEIPANSSVEYTIRVTVNVLDVNWCGYAAVDTVQLEGDEWDPERIYDRTSVTILCHSLNLSASVDTGDEAGVVLYKPFDYILSVTNSGQTADGDFSLNAILNPNVNIVGDLPADCSATPQQDGTTLVTCTGDAVPIGESGVSFSIPVMAVDEDIENSPCYDSTILGYSTGDGLWLNASGVIYLDTPADCTTDVSASISPLSSPVNPGDPIGWTISFTNTGNTRITSFKLDPPTPAPLPDGASWTVRWEMNGEPVDIENFNGIYPGDTLNYVVESPLVPTDITGPESEWCQDWTFDTAYGVESPNVNRVGGFLKSTVSVNCTDLLINQQVSSATIAPNGEVTYTVTVTNNGNLTVDIGMAFDATNTSQLFSNWRFATDTDAQCSIGGNGQAVCFMGNLGPQQSAVFTFTADAPGPDSTMCEPVTTTALAMYNFAAQPQSLLQLTPPLTAVESNEVTTQLDCTYDLTVDHSEELLTGEDGRMDAGDQIRYTFTIANSGTMNLYDLAVVEEAGLLVWDSDTEIAELPAGEEITLTATYTVTQADLDNGSISISASVSGNAPTAPVAMLGFAAQAAPDPAVTTPIDVTTTLQQEPVLALTLASSPDSSADPVEVGDTVTYTITVTNGGNVTLTDLEVVGDLANLQFADGTTINSLDPGASTELTATYIVTTDDATAGSLALCADGTALDPAQTAISATQACIELHVAAQPVETPSPTQTETATPAPTEPATPAPTETSTPTASETPAPTAGVTGLPDTGQGGPSMITPVIWAAAMSMLALGGMSFGIRRSSRS